MFIQIARSFIFEVLRRRDLLGKHPRLYDTLFRTYLRCPEQSILIFLFRNKNFVKFAPVNPFDWSQKFLTRRNSFMYYFFALIIDYIYKL